MPKTAKNRKEVLPKFQNSQHILDISPYLEKVSEEFHDKENNALQRDQYFLGFYLPLKFYVDAKSKITEYGNHLPQLIATCLGGLLLEDEDLMRFLNRTLRRKNVVKSRKISYDRVEKARIKADMENFALGEEISEEDCCDNDITN
jgi:hypothetical protein